MLFLGGDVVSLGDFVVATLLSAVIVLQFLTDTNPIGRSWLLLRQLHVQEKLLKTSSDVKSGYQKYYDMHEKEGVEKRKSDYKDMVNSYYDLSTVFFEWGWGKSFHFAYHFANESFREAIHRHQCYLASKLCLTGDEKKVLDVGCGVGEPLRNISRFTGADATGITINQYQVDRGNHLCRMDPVVQDRCRLVQGDFMNMKALFHEEQFDAAFAIEATCHAPDRVGVFREVFRVLKPGSIFGTYEWCMTDLYTKGDPEHERLKKVIETGESLPDLCHYSVCVNAMKEAGFEILEARDMSNDYLGPRGKPWYIHLTPSWNMFSQRFQFTGIGFAMTTMAVRLLEFLWLAPKGSSKTQHLLAYAGVAIGQAGQAKIFTPMYLIVGRVPEKMTQG